MPASQKLSHLLQLADQGPGLRAALAEEVADLLIHWPADYPPAMRGICETLLAKAARDVDADTRARLRVQLYCDLELSHRVLPRESVARNLVADPLVGGRAVPGSPCDAAQVAHLVALLLDFAADLDAQDERGVSALHACAIHGLLGCARQLLARGAERDIRDCLGRRPADLARLLGYADVANELGAGAAIPSLAQMLRQPAAGRDG